MNKTLIALYDSFYTPPKATNIREEIETLHKQLILQLDKPERRLVLHLIDAKDHLTEEVSIDSFICGFRLAWQLANELDQYPENGHPARPGTAEQNARSTLQAQQNNPDEEETSLLL